MAQQLTPTTGSSILDTVPLFVLVLLAVHVFALVRPIPPPIPVASLDSDLIPTPHCSSLCLQVFWMYKLASDKPPPRRKTQ
ncbi:hypothetical protein PR202_ga00683 [Eleusine coracana subsp. coracana]|uniref:Uncharacterized protein n=1 Tax=Eleusine coracana subsp. coracana TaxID=191504 RepID=A0AAV5BGY0_ELECO|nr:hypothetical protein PR202_ga00683 [Eleusine coracana subsp. coracana]